MLDRAIATQHAELTRTKPARTRVPPTMRKRLRVFRQRCLQLLRRLGELISTGGPLS
jgi:hypothetical protein